MYTELPRINKIIFKVFLISIFFVYYEIKFITGTLHAWLMIFGLLLTIPILVKRYGGGSGKIPRDYLLIIILFLLIVLGFLANYSTTNWLNFQAYTLMLVTYVYVKENTSDDALIFLSFVIKYFLLINCILMILQLFTGSYFPARFFAAGDPPLIFATGVSEGATKNGMLISFALSHMFARLIFKNNSFLLSDFLIFLVGIISLLVATSRAGLFSFATVVVFGGIFALVQSIRKKEYKLSYSNIAVIAGFIYAAFEIILWYGLDYEILYDLRDFSADRYGLDAMVHKLTVFNDDSTEERFGTIEFGIKQIFESPLHLFSAGFGAGTFEKIFGLNIHNSYFELLFTTGLFGFLVFLSLVVNVVRKALFRIDVLEIIPVLFSLLSIMSFMFVHDVLRGRVFWIALGIASAFAYSNFRRDKGAT